MMTAMCRNFGTPDGCRFGANCRFSHGDTPTAAHTQTISAPEAAICRHFLLPTGCRNGDGCRYSHRREINEGVQHLTHEQETLLRTVETRQVPTFALDVECVATGITHNDRSVAQIGVVDADFNVVFNAYVKPSKSVISYLTPLTGIHAQLIQEKGISFEEAMLSLREILPKNAVIVGHNIGQDAQWLGLHAPADVSSLLDTAALFRAYDPMKRRWNYFSQDHIAKVWLNKFRPPGGHHDAVGDAMISMRLLHAFISVRRDSYQLELLKSQTINTPRAPSFAVTHPVFEGVCMGNRSLCQCGAPHFT
uniref:C3H1-type domain-containing protein n=1 Tax=Aureoumbra lagunensis TaxID=44058 RepID=A0A7S3JUD6_9STRA|mmetsp:Transcript_13787/g.18409  ORF Transcript_13787/g.18409 Transcript_13787/m.18409 type:complete len:307 (+) Transcript_13787:139-1059(+)